jgi:glycosyltransferase involved in cell wall biosynthesis
VLRILIITSEAPYPPTSGGSIRVYGLVRGLASLGHSVHVLCFGSGQTHTALSASATVQMVAPAGRSPWARLGTLLLTPQADIETRLWSAAFQQALVEVLRSERYDIIQFEGIEMGCYMGAARAAQPETPIVFDTFNAEADLQRAIASLEQHRPGRLPQAAYSWVQYRRLRRYERELCHLASAVIAVSDEDAALLREYTPSRPPYVVPSGIFVDDYTADVRRLALGERSLVFTGKMDYRPNADAVLWFMQSVLPRLSGTQLVIVGQKPTAPVMRLAAQHGAWITGFVESVIPYLRGAAVYVAPLRMGSGTRLKILEALACGCAIVATSVAASGLNDALRAAMVIADDAEAFASAVDQLLRDSEQRQALQQQAPLAVRAHYDWSVILGRLVAVYNEVAGGQRRTDRT